MDIGNYHFFVSKKKLFIYDTLHNLLFSAKKVEDYAMLKEILKRYSQGKDITQIEKDKYSLVLKNYTNENTIFNTETFINKENLFSTKLTLMISQSCNLKCSYCYGKEGRFGTNGEYMSNEIAEQSIRHLVERIESLKLPKSENPKYFLITFFGGEPLLNFELMKHVIEFVEREYPNKVFSYTFTTNGTLFTEEIINYLRTKNVSILISLDGQKEIHDFNRVFSNGKGTFDKVMSNINLLKKNNMQFSVRATLSNKFFKYYESIANYFIELGAQQIFIGRLTNYDIDSNDFDINIEELKQDVKYATKYNNKIKDKILQGDYPDFIPFITILKRIHDATDTLISCGFMKGSTAVSYNGDLYPCHRFVGIDGFKFGNVYSGLEETPIQNIVKKIDKVTVKCNNCWAKFICQRGCMRDIAKNHGNFIPYDKRYCNLQRKKIEWALEVYYDIIKQQPEFIKQNSEKEIEIHNIV